jgi:hypothetical protein
VTTQLALLDTDRILTAAEAGLAARIEEGPACLLAALVKRGLSQA